jgi:general secretion pathway protein M
VKEWFGKFDQREQLSLLALAAAIVLYFVYMLVWSPLNSSRAELIEQNVRVASSLERVDAMVSELLFLRESGSATSRSRVNVTSLVNRTTASAGLQVSRLQPNSRGEIQVRLEGAVFDNVLGWLHAIEYQHGLLVREVSITQSGDDGRVNATVRVAQGD